MYRQDSYLELCVEALRRASLGEQSQTSCLYVSMQPKSCCPDRPQSTACPHSTVTCQAEILSEVPSCKIKLSVQWWCSCTGLAVLPPALQLSPSKLYLDVTEQCVKLSTWLLVTDQKQCGWRMQSATQDWFHSAILNVSRHPNDISFSVQLHRRSSFVCSPACNIEPTEAALNLILFILAEWTQQKCWPKPS